jgi:hypothetical protein
MELFAAPWIEKAIHHHLAAAFNSKLEVLEQ